ncbi:MAG: hypothetical protein KGL43_26720 [Burkholderiales bacterium]|nr:hypothetical protein [Burkholderiales bacterium]
MNPATPLAGLEWARLLLLPAIGFLAGLAAQWFLQERKSRDELQRALAAERAQALRQLWELTSLPPELTRLGAQSAVPAALRERIDRAILAWYTEQAGALYLSWPATQALFRLLDRLRDAACRKPELESSVSSLRTRLKHDCGIYSSREMRRPLARPRPAPWAAETEDDGY